MKAPRGILGGNDWVIAPMTPWHLAAALRMIAMDTATRQTLGHQLRSVVERDQNLTALNGKIITAAEGQRPTV